jgi:hypothetical protein
MSEAMNKSKIALIALTALALSGCNIGGRNINYNPLVTENLSYLQRTSREMADAAQVEIIKNLPADQLAQLLAAISRGSVSEVQESLGGFYLVEGQKFEAVYQGGAGGGPRELEPVEKAQLNALLEKVILEKKYDESVNNFYEREVAQVGSPVIVEGRVVAVAWMRRRLPSQLMNVVEEPKFNRTSTQKQQH